MSPRWVPLALFAVASTLGLTLVSCASGIKQFYHGVYYPQDRIYQNETLGFGLMFPAGWRVVVDPSRMDRTRRQAARLLHAQNAELAFAGETVEGTQGTRAIVENVNHENDEFLVALRKANAAGIDQDLGATTFMAGNVLSVKWQYVYHGMRFVEFLFRAGTHNVRIAFWTKPELYDRFLPVYENIMATLAVNTVR